jgi:hypothetical protein
MAIKFMQATCFIVALSLVPPVSLAQMSETLDAARLKREAVTLSFAGRQAFREALLACASYHEHYREESLQLECERQINVFDFDFAKEDSRITLFLKSVMNLARREASAEEGVPAKERPQQRAKRGQYFLDQLLTAYKESRP